MGIGTVAVLQGKFFLVFVKWNNSASTDGQGPIPSRQSGARCAQREAAAQLRSSQAEQGRVCGFAIRHWGYFCQARQELISSCFVDGLLANGSRSPL